MIEYLDTYDINHNYLGSKPRSEVHENGLWHDTVHCWLYDDDKNVYFQVRKDEKTLYTTASGHVVAGETVKEAFGREVKEEIGIDVDYNEAIKVNIYKFKMDKIKNNKPFIDRAFSNVYICKYNNQDFNFDINEVDSVVRVSAKDTMDLFLDKKDTIDGIKIDMNNKRTNVKLTKDDFLLNDGETLMDKYGDVLKKVMTI